MSKNNSEKIESELEASNVFTLKGEDETQIEQSANIDIETNKKSHEPPDSPNEVIITNLTNYSFGIPEHDYSSENGEINESIKGLFGSFEKDKKSISPKRRKYNSVLKITFKKNNTGKIIKVKKEVINKKVTNKNVTINEKEIDNLLEATNSNIENNDNNNDEPSEDNKMEIETSEKKEQKKFHSDGIIQEENENSISEHNEFDKKVKEDLNNNSINIKENSSDMIIEQENSDEHEKENEKNNENEINNINGVVSENVLNDISRLTLENGLNKVIKEQLGNKNNIELNKEEQEEKKEEEIIQEESAEIIRKENEDKNVINEVKEIREEKKIINDKKYNDEENKIMANEDINMKDKFKVKEIGKIQEKKDEKENDKEKTDEVKVQRDKLCDEKECNEKNDIAQNVINNNEINSFDQAIEDLIAEVNKDNDNEDMKEKDKNIPKKEDANNINNKKIDNIVENENKRKENENKEEEKKIKEEKKEESNQILANTNIFQNQINIDIEKFITEKLSLVIKDILKDKQNNSQALLNPEENINTQIKEDIKEDENKKEKDSNNNFLGKKRDKTSSISSDNPRKLNSPEKKEKEIKNKPDINNNGDSSLGKMLEKYIFNYLYDKVMTKSLSDDSDLEKKINNFIKEKGYSKVKSSLINAKKEKEKKENINPSVPRKELDEIHYSLVNNFYHRFKSIKTKDGFQTYICCDRECKALAKLNIKERKFELIQSHTVALKDHLHFNDDRPVFFMKSRKLDEVHIKRNEHNEKYHLEWFN